MDIVHYQHIAAHHMSVFGIRNLVLARSSVAYQHITVTL